MRHIRRKIDRFGPALFSFCMVILLASFVLLTYPKIGMADNGDFYRIMVSNDLAHLANRPSSDSFSYFNSNYSMLKYYNPLSASLNTTHSIIIQLGIFMNKMLTKDSIFHIEFIAIQLIVVLAFAVALLVDEVCYFLKSRWLKYLCAMFAVVIFADTGYTAYFSSFFGESVTYPFFLLSIGALLKIGKNGGGWQIFWILLFTFATYMFMGSKNQFAASGILAALLLLILIPMVIRRQKIVAGITLMCACALVALALSFYKDIDEDIYLINKYHSVTRGLILYEPSADQLLVDIGVDPKYEVLKGSIFFDYTPLIHPRDAVLLDDFYAHYDLFKLTKYYLLNPNQLYKVLSMGGKNSFSIRPEVIGNYERASGKEASLRTSTFTMWSYFKENSLPHKIQFLTLCLLISLALGFLRLYQNRLAMSSWQRFACELTWIYLVGIGLSQILVSIIGAGDTDLKKHLFLVNVVFDIMIFYNVSYLISEFNQKP